MERLRSIESSIENECANVKWTEPANEETIAKTSEALRNRGVNVQFSRTKEEALRKLKELIPAGSSLTTGASETLKEIGFTDCLKTGKHGWTNLKEKIVAEKDPSKQRQLRKQSVLADYFLGSVQAVTQSGEVFVASNTGSQLPSYAYTSDNVIWVVGAQKIVENMEEAMKRIREYCLPLEDKRMKEAGAKGSAIGKILIFERETLPNRKVTLIFANEKIGV